MLKSLIKNTNWWDKISFSEFYLKYRNPKAYNDFLKEVHFYRSLLNTKENIIFDVGANAGFKSRIFSKFSEKIVLFEPNESLIKSLKNRFPNKRKYTIICKALGEKNENKEYFTFENESAYNSLSTKHVQYLTNKSIIRIDKNVNRINVDICTLDFYIKEIGKPNYIKIDVEGYEKQVILGLTIPIDFISFECNLPTFQEETYFILHYLNTISKGNYRYNLEDSFKMKFEKDLTLNEMINVLTTSKFNTIEIYCKLLKV